MTGLLAPDEGPAVETREGQGPVVVVCEHASNRMPRALGTLGLPVSDLDRHIAWDPGAREIAAGIADRLGGDLILQNYSRLAIDCNREPSLADAIAARSEDTDIPGNTGLNDGARAARVDEIWTPFHDALERRLDARKAKRLLTALATMHTFTPVYRGVSRPWHVGIISTDEPSLANAMLATLRRELDLVVGDNQPYSSKDNVDYTIRRHGRDRGLPHVMIEVRNDLARTPGDIEAWSDLLAGALRESAAAVGIGQAARFGT